MIPIAIFADTAPKKKKFANSAPTLNNQTAIEKFKKLKTIIYNNKSMKGITSIKLYKMIMILYYKVIIIKNSKLINYNMKIRPNNNSY